MTRVLRLLMVGIAVLTVSIAMPPNASAQPHGGTMVIGVNGDPPAIIGFTNSDTAAYEVAANIFSGLIGMNSSFQPVPDLAQSWSISPDGTTYTFHLNPAAKFQDGVPVTADDAAYTFSQVVCKYHPSRGSWCPNVAAFEVAGPHTFVIKLRRPYPPLMMLLAYQLRSGALILPKHIYAGSDPTKNPINDHPIGSGPFKFVEWQRGSYVRLERNPDYFMPGRPFLDGLIIQVVQDPSALMLAFESGDVDFIDSTGVPFSELARIEKDPRFAVLHGDALGILGYWILNLRNPVLGKLQVRQAMYHALDINDIADESLFGAGKTPHSMMSSVLTTFFTPKYDTYTHNVALANQILDAAGVPRGPNGVRFKIGCDWAEGRPYNEKACELISDQLRAVGINVQVQSYDRPTLIDRVFAQWNFDTAVELITTGPDPAIGMTTRFATNQINRSPYTNAMGYSNPALDALFARDAVEIDPAKRVEYWDQAQKILMHDLPVIPLFEFPDGNLVNKKFHDVVTGPFGYFQGRQEAYYQP